MSEVHIDLVKVQEKRASEIEELISDAVTACSELQKAQSELRTALVHMRDTFERIQRIAAEIEEAIVENATGIVSLQAAQRDLRASLTTLREAFEKELERERSRQPS